MIDTDQTQGQNILEHGTNVWSYTKKILNKDLINIKVPTWLIENYDLILENLFDYDIIKLYNVYHDCGKPYCKVIKDEKVHFPNHAEISSEIFKNIFFEFMDVEKLNVISELIKNDMILHTSTSDDIKNIICSTKFPKKFACTLLVTALSELNSNSKLFGGTDSISFKMKWKKLDRRGKMLLKEVIR